MKKTGKLLLEGSTTIGVWGVGHIGYSTMSHFAEQGVQCIGYDIDPTKVEEVNRGEIPILNMDYWLGFAPGRLYRSGIARATTDWQELMDPSVAVHFICVPTEQGIRPFLEPLMDVCQKLVTRIQRSADPPPLIIIESTLTPGTVDREVIPFFENQGLKVGQHLLLGCAPRRDWFSSPDKSMGTLARVFAGTDPVGTEAIRSVLSIVCQNLVEAPSHLYAEAVKSIENAYRQLGVALALELSRAYPNLDMKRVLELVGTKWNMETYYPSVGVGGYCLPAASYYVLEGAERPEDLMLLKQTIATCEEQPTLVVQSLLKMGVKSVGFLGLSYTQNMKVHAQSPTLTITAGLQKAGVEVKVHDPYYSPEEVREITGFSSFAYPEGLHQFDAVLMIAGHREYRAVNHQVLGDSLQGCKLVLDNTGLWRDVDFRSRGIEYHMVGDAGWMQLD